MPSKLHVLLLASLIDKQLLLSQHQLTTAFEPYSCDRSDLASLGLTPSGTDQSQQMSTHDEIRWMPPSFLFFVLFGSSLPNLDISSFATTGIDDYSPGSVWYYAPNKAAPIVFIILFFVSGTLHAYQTNKHKSWRTTVLLPWAALLMICGFSTRLAGAYHTSDLGILIASTVLIMSGPPVYALINYFVLSRMLYYMPYLAPMHPGRIATTFIGLDAVCEILIGSGAWRMANSSLTDAQRQVGANMVMASLCLQATLFAGFGLFAALFHRKALRAGVLKKEMKTVLYVMYISAFIVTIRCIYRLVEYILGWKSAINRNEVYFWIFEAVIMFVNTALLNVFHPGKRLPRSNGTFLAKDGITERRGPGWEDDRPWPVTVFDPLDIWGLIRGKDQETKFWDMSDEELERVRLEKKANKRSVLAALMDPFRLWGERGYVGKYLERRKRRQEFVARDRGIDVLEERELM